MQKSVSLTREHLYELVWSKPLVELATQFGVSDVAVAKACRKHKVPLPGRGYWQAGHRIRRPRLPPAPEVPEHITFTPVELNDAVQRLQTEFASTLRQQIVVPDELKRPHTLVRHTRDVLAKGEYDDRGRTIPRSDTLNIRVTKELLPRALRVADTLIRAIEELGGRVMTSGDEQRWSTYVSRRLRTYVKTAMVFDNERVGLIIREENKVCKDNRKLVERYRRRCTWGGYIPNQNLVPTGRLILELDGVWIKGVQKNWADGKRNLEEFLTDILTAIFTATKIKHEETVARRGQERRQEELRRQQEIDEQRKREEAARAAELKQEAALWAQAQQIRAYVAALVDVMAGSTPAEAWVTWARQQADNLDPLAGRMKKLAQI